MKWKDFKPFLLLLLQKMALHFTLLSSLPTDSSSIRCTRVVTNSYNAFSNLYALTRHGSCKDICRGGNVLKIFIHHRYMEEHYFVLKQNNAIKK